MLIYLSFYKQTVEENSDDLEKIYVPTNNQVSPLVDDITRPILQRASLRTKEIYVPANNQLSP